MARPQKEGLDYFPVDVDIDQDDKLVVPIAKHGMLGFGVIVKLMMEVYKNGYFYPWTEKEKYVFPFKINVDVEKVGEIVIDCINSGFFCINQYNRNHILTSYGFQKRFLLASTRRKESVINIQYLVEKELMSTKTELMQTETQKMDAESTQRKVKEIKEKKLKDINKILYGDFIQMTSEQYNSLITDYGLEITKKYILSIDDWFAQDEKRLKKYSDHSRMVRTWKRNDDLKKPTSVKGAMSSERSEQGNTGIHGKSSTPLTDLFAISS